MSKADQRNIRLLLVDDHTLFRESVRAPPAIGTRLPKWLLIVAPAQKRSRSWGSHPRKIDVSLLDSGSGKREGADFFSITFEMRISPAKCCSSPRTSMRLRFPGLIRKGISGSLHEHGSPALLVRRNSRKLWRERHCLTRFVTQSLGTGGRRLM